MTSTTAKDGSFALVGIPPGRTVVTVRAGGYLPELCPFRFLPGSEFSTKFTLVPRAMSNPPYRCPSPPPIGAGETKNQYTVGN